MAHRVVDSKGIATLAAAGVLHGGDGVRGNPVSAATVAGMIRAGLIRMRSVAADEREARTAALRMMAVSQLGAAELVVSDVDDDLVASVSFAGGLSVEVYAR